MNVRPRPCEQCPWRRDIDPGQFPADRYEHLADTTGRPGEEASMDAPIFGCHKSTEGNEMPCAGWLAAVGIDSLRVRLLVSNGAIPVEALSPGEDWPPLFDSYEEMAATQGGPAGGESVCFTVGCRYHLQPQTVTPGYPCPGCRTPTTAVELRRGR